MKKDLITGVTGQEGSHLAEILLRQAYEAHSIGRRISTFRTELYQNKHKCNVELEKPEKVLKNKVYRIHLKGGVNA